jgi:hypothetical protein
MRKWKRGEEEKERGREKTSEVKVKRGRGEKESSFERIAERVTNSSSPFPPPLHR